jgi:hypothetical protein
MPFADPRVHALLNALCVFGLLPDGLTNRGLRAHLAPHLAPLFGEQLEGITRGHPTWAN